MRKKLLLNYLYICALSVLFQSQSCFTQTANSAASYSDGQVHGNEERTAIELKQNEGQRSDETNQRSQRDQVIDKRTTGTFRQVRQKRELRDTATSVRLRGSSNPLGKVGLTSGEQRFKKSNHRMDQDSGELFSKENNVRVSSAAGDVRSPEEQANQDKRDLNKQQGVTSSSSISMEKDGAKSGQREEKRNSISSKAVGVIKPKSRALKEADVVAQGSLAKDKLKVHVNERYVGLSDYAKTQKQENGNEPLEDEVDLDEKSTEYDETGDDDEDPEAPAGDTEYKENDAEISQAGEEYEKLDLLQSSAGDDDFESQGIVKRDTGVVEEQYEDIEDQDDACDDVSLVDESNYQQAKDRSESRLLGESEKDGGRVKRHDIEASETVLDKNEAPDPNGAAKQQGKNLEHFENVRTPMSTSFKFGVRTRGENLKRQVTPEKIEKDKTNGQTDSETKETSNEGTNDSSKEEARFQEEVHTDNSDKSNAGGQPNVRLDSEKPGSSDPVIEDVHKKEANVDTETKEVSNVDATAKNDELNSDYEKKVAEQIQQKIDTIKEEIKREVEEKQRVREIEENNAKYDEIQSEIDEDEDEDNQSLDIPNERKSILKRSIIDRVRSPQIKTKRHILRRVKRSDPTNVQQLRAVEGVERLDPDVYIKGELRHESIRKRSAPIYGAADKDAPDTSKPLLKRSANHRRVYLVSNEQKRSPISGEQEVRNTIIIPEHAHVNIEDELPPGLSLDQRLLEDSFSGKYRLKRSPDRFARRRRASAVVPEGRVAFLGYRPQDDDENDEGSEFDDDGFEDRTSNLQEDKSYVIPHIPTNNQYSGDEPRDENPANFLFAGIDRGRDDFLVRRKRAGIRDDEEPIRLHGGGALARRQTLARAKQMQTAQITSKKSAMDRDKRQTGSGFDHAKSDSVASLVGSSQELSPRLASEYKEAFGGLQNDPGGALARFKRVKRGALRGSLD